MQEPASFRYSPLPGFQGLSWVALACALASAAGALLGWLQRHDPTQALLLAAQGAVLLLLWRRVFRPLPSEVRVDGGDLLFRNLPTWRLQVYGLEVPVVVAREVRIPLRDMVPEWIGGALTWNDLARGRSLFLARGEQAVALAAWMQARGVPVPVGG